MEWYKYSGSGNRFAGGGRTFISKLCWFKNIQLKPLRASLHVFFSPCVIRYGANLEGNYIWIRRKETLVKKRDAFINVRRRPWKVNALAIYSKNKWGRSVLRDSQCALRTTEKKEGPRLKNAFCLIDDERRADFPWEFLNGTAKSPFDSRVLTRGTHRNTNTHTQTDTPSSEPWTEAALPLSFPKIGNIPQNTKQAGAGEHVIGRSVFRQICPPFPYTQYVRARAKARLPWGGRGAPGAGWWWWWCGRGGAAESEGGGSAFNPHPLLSVREWLHARCLSLG